MLRSKDNLYQEIVKFIEDADDLIIFSPYITFDALQYLLSFASNNAQSNTCVITTWKPRDVAFGSSDLNVYQLSKTFNFPLYINNNIHLKVIAKNNLSSCIVSSANITGRGIGGSHPVAVLPFQGQSLPGG